MNINNSQNLSQYIEHTLLKPDITQEQIHNFCEEANLHKFIGVCVNPCWLREIKTLLLPEIIRVTVIGFPLGANTSLAKAYEAENAITCGAQEIDMVINIGWLKSGLFKEVLREIQQVKQTIGSLPLKVIIETGLLTQKEKYTATQIVLDSGADYIKTSTGFSGGGATNEDIVLFKQVIGSHSLKIKASGGIRSKEQAFQLIALGVHRLGTSQGPHLVKDLNSNINYVY